MTNVHGVGIDGIEIERIRKVALKYGDIFLNRIYTPEELEYCFGKKNPYPSLAVRFAAKEAVAKAFGVGIGADLGWQSIKVLINGKGAPIVELDKKGCTLLKQKSGEKILVSLSHTAFFAQAIAILGQNS